MPPSRDLLHVAARTYALSLSLSLAPSLVPLVVSRKARSGGVKTLLSIFRRELGWNGFAFAMTVGVGGGKALKQLWEKLEERRTRLQTSGQEPSTDATSRLLDRALASPYFEYAQSIPESGKTFLANALSATIAILLLHSKRPSTRRYPKAALPMTIPMQDSSKGGRVSPTLDLTLLLFVRAMDFVVRSTVLPKLALSDTKGSENGSAGKESGESVKRRRIWTSRLDALVFWASSARIMWCFFYEPARLPRSYNKWIMSLANIDPRILGALRGIRTGDISYRTNACNPPDLLSSLSTDLGYPSAWGDISRIPAFGGVKAADAWKAIGVPTRDGLGGIPCELVHGGVTGSSCTANAVIRGAHAFVEALAIYLPVHTVPILLTDPQKFLRPLDLLSTSLSVLRSSAFLSTFVSSIWLSVCLTRTLLLARLLPGISHDFWDGPLGCTYMGSLVCGASIWIEQGRRRGEMALYVLPRALRACLSERWLRSGKLSVKLVERIVFVLSLATLLTAASHRTDSLRGLSRWTLAFIMKGPRADFWRRKTRTAKLKPSNGTNGVAKHEKNGAATHEGG